MNIFKLTSLLIVIISINLNAQEKTIYKKNFHKHKGFYLSIGLGANHTNILWEEDYNHPLKISGYGPLFDFKIGAAIVENLILHATITSKSAINPNFEQKNEVQKSEDDLSMGQGMIGGGLTYYFMPSNIFLSGSIGMGGFGLTNHDLDESYGTENGFSFELKLGKEWWISRRWGIGAALTYSKTNVVETTPYYGTNHDLMLNSNNFGLMVNATFN